MATGLWDLAAGCEDCCQAGSGMTVEKLRRWC